MEIGRLPDLIDLMAGCGAGLLITPVLEEGRSLTRGLDEEYPYDPVVYITGWAVTYETPKGTFTSTGESLPMAVDAAIANPDAW